MTQPFGASSLFPQLPQVDWLYRQEIIIRKVDVDAGTVDDEGRWLAGQSISEHPTMAFVCMVGEERHVTTEQGREEIVDAVARVRRNTDVRYIDEVEISGVSFDLDGLYRVVKVGYNPVDLRLMLQRVADDDTFIAGPAVVSGEVGLHGHSL
jgi:hypothetical protein